MRCEEIMRKNIRWVTEEMSVEKVAEIMRDENVGFLPVVTDEATRRLVGVVTDRDLVVHAIAENREPRTTNIGYLVSRDVVTASPGEELDEVERKMIDAKVHRLAVVDQDRAVLGTVSLYDIAQREEPAKTGNVLKHTSDNWARA